MRWHAWLAISCASLLLGESAAQSELWSAPTSSYSDETGWSSAGGEDVDGDGVADLIVGSFDDTSGGVDAGAARVFSGLDGSLIYEKFGTAGDLFGFCVDVAGDVNGDGFSDFVVGAYGDDAGGPGAGSATVFSGESGAVLHTFVGTAYEFVGTVARGAGDVNADGYDDVLVTAPGANQGAGLIEVRSGKDASVLLSIPGTMSGVNFGRYADDVGDVDADGHGDIAYVDHVGDLVTVSGATGSVLHTVASPAPNSGFGRSFAGLGDVDGDGRGDFAVGSPQENGAGIGTGAVRVYSGASGSLIRQITQLEPHQGFGSSVTAVGDVDVDGVTDIGVGTVGAIASRICSVYSGATGEHRFSVELDVFSTGASRLIGLGDVDYDGSTDFAVTATRGALTSPFTPWNDPYLRGVTTPRFVRELVQANTAWLYAVGDVDGDGFDDYAEVTSPSHVSVDVISSATGQVLLAALPVGLGGGHISGVGDVNGDGFDDLVVPVSNTLANVLSGADASTLFTVSGSVATAVVPRGRSIGDVNGDARPDVLFGLGRAAGGDGEATVRSGIDGSVIFSYTGSVPSAQFGSSFGPAGDVSGDGVPDFVVSDSSQSFVFSGADGSTLHTFPYPFAARAGDQDGDGFEDVLVASWFSAVDAALLSGVDGSVLRTLGSYRSGFAIGDADHDGFEDFAMQPQATLPLAIVSGATGDVVGEYEYVWFGGFGDVDGDGVREICANFGGSIGPGRILDVFSRKASQVRSVGRSCAGSDGRLPQLHLFGHPVFEESPTLVLRAGLPSAPAVMLVGPPAIAPIPLDVIGAVGCTAYFSLTASAIPLSLDPAGMASVGWTIGSGASLLGARFDFQCFVLDPAANAAGLSASAGLACVLGGR